MWQRTKPPGRRNFQEEGIANENVQGEIEPFMLGGMQDQCDKISVLRVIVRSLTVYDFEDHRKKFIFYCQTDA